MLPGREGATGAQLGHGVRADKKSAVRPAAPPRGAVLRTSNDGIERRPCVCPRSRRYSLSRAVLRRRSPLVASWSLYGDTGHLREAVDAGRLLMSLCVRVRKVAVGVDGLARRSAFCVLNKRSFN